MIITNARIEGELVNVRIAGYRIAEVGEFAPSAEEHWIDARGAALLPGLHDHHLHLFALAARHGSVSCGPPEVGSPAQLASALTRPGSGWLRGTGYHESVAGMLDAATLDGITPDRPVRVQHRGGRMWFLNTFALDTLLAAAAPPPGLERTGGSFTGRLFDDDQWLRKALGGTFPDIGATSIALAAYGITGLTDMSPANDPATASHFARQHRQGTLLQSITIGGTLQLADWQDETAGVRIGPAKIHLHEAALPDLAQSSASIRSAHRQQRNVAIHCTTEVELVFALTALEEAGPRTGDRIEHASVTPDHLLDWIRRLELQVVVQPHFVAERGDAYKACLPPEVWPDLYRLRAFADAGVVLAGGSDAPFGRPDPWAAMAAGVGRRTSDGSPIGISEALTPEEALDLFLADPLELRRRRRIAPGEMADLCLLDRPWSQARTALSAGCVRMTVIRGSVVYDRVDQPPVERDRRCNPPAGEDQQGKASRANPAGD